MAQLRSISCHIDGILRVILVVGRSPESVVLDTRLYCTIFRDLSDDRNCTMERLYPTCSNCIFMFGNIGCIVSNNIVVPDCNVTVLTTADGFRFHNILRDMCHHFDFNNNAPEKEPISGMYHMQVFGYTIHYKYNNPYDLKKKEKRRALIFRTFNKENAIAHCCQSFESVRIKSVFHIVGSPYICILAPYDIQRFEALPNIEYLLITDPSLGDLMQQIAGLGQMSFVSPLKKHILAPDDRDREKFATLSRWIISRPGDNKLNGETSHIDRTMYESLYSDFSKEQISNTNRKFISPKQTSTQQEHNESTVGRTPNWEYSKVVIGIKELIRYVNYNSNEMCPFFIIEKGDDCDALEFGLKSKFGAKLEWALLNLYTDTSGNIFTIDRVHLLEEFALIFLKSEDNASEFANNKQRIYKVCGELDFMFPGFFDEKYEEVRLCINQIRDHRMVLHANRLKAEAEAETARKSRELQLILAQREAEKFIRTLDIDIAKTEYMFDILRINTPKIKTIMKMYHNSSEHDIHNMIYKMVAFMMKQFICDNVQITYHPWIYCGVMTFLIGGESTNSNFVSVATGFMSLVDSLKGDICRFENVNAFLKIPANIEINVSKNVAYYGSNMTNTLIVAISNKLNYFIQKSNVLCFKQIFVDMFITIVNSRIHENGLFMMLPKDILIIIFDNMLQTLKID